MVIYHGILADDDGLPLCTDKEINAIAAYIGYVYLFKKALILRDKYMNQLAMSIKAD